MKPIIHPQVESKPLPLECASGRMSSATMKIIAPAANANPNGKIVWATETARAPEEEREENVILLLRKENFKRLT